MLFTLLDNCVGKQCAVQCRSGKCIQHNFCYHNQKWKVVCSLQARLKCTADIKIYCKLCTCMCVYYRKTVVSLDSTKIITELFLWYKKHYHLFKVGILPFFMLSEFDSSHGQWTWTHYICLLTDLTWLWAARFTHFY